MRISDSRTTSHRSSRFTLILSVAGTYLVYRYLGGVL
jgi:hypothetical protein